MNISSLISIHESNSSDLLSNGTEAETVVLSIMCILIRFPINSYVIWLIGTGTGNGLAAELLILNLSFSEILLCVEALLMCFNIKINLSLLLFFHGLLIISRPLFESLICVERYLAVVHPVTFLKYKPLRYRLMCSAVVWMASLASSGVFVICRLNFLIALFFLLFSIQLFCCQAVLRALKQSGPGERGREREEKNNMKKRAFYLILIATVITGIIYGPYFILLFIVVYATDSVFETAVYVGQYCFISAGLVQPVLFLYRVGKFNFIKRQYVFFSSKSL